MALQVARADKSTDESINGESVFNELLKYILLSEYIFHILENIPWIKELLYLNSK